MAGGAAVATPKSAGDPIPPACRLIEVRVAELRQLFNAIDPSPFNERDLDPKAEEFIIDWAKDLPANAPLALVVYLDRAAGETDEAAVLREAIHEFFGQRAASARRRLREVFHRGRISLLIGVGFLAGLIALGNRVESAFPGSHWTGILRESFLIGGWVAMWRPLEVFLYDWWPIRADARLYDRLSAMPVRIEYTGENRTSAWRSDWPAVSPGDEVSPSRSHPAPAVSAGSSPAGERRSV
jgi:hypothetical protein